ncbi:MAG: FAD-dependent oxidoreductase [Candidatus Omnitrophica bacterium]|nr:FAD-dependent oxidoreductase [Candidatus Omnitrophota bacterium]
MAKEQKFIILGAGLSGLSAAYFLKEDYLIFEKESTPGGLCRSRHIKGYTFDYDGHLLHFKNKAMLELVRRLLGRELISVKRNSWVASFGDFTRYPFQANLYGLPRHIVKECIFGFLDARLNGYMHRSDYDNFKHWIIHTFGEGIAKHFMLPYNNKFWTVPAQRLTCEWVKNYIPVPTIKDVLNGTIAQSKKRFGYNAKFWYPLNGGIERLVLAFQKQIKGEIYTQHQVTQIDLDRKNVTFQNEKKLKFENLISTIPLPEMLKLIPRLPTKIKTALGKLRYSSIFCLNLGIARGNLSDKHWIYFPEKKFVFFRVGFPSSFSSEVVPQGKSSIYAEVSYSPNRPPDKEYLSDRILEDLAKAGILSCADAIEVCDPLDIKYGYIIYDHNYKANIKTIQEYLNQHHVYLIGRYGRWKYMAMEDAILDGKNIAQRIRGE